MESLGMFGPEARRSLPLIVRYLDGGDWAVDAAATILRIDPTNDKAMEKVVERLNGTLNNYYIALIADVLAELGPRAKPAVGSLIACWQANTDTYTGAKLVDALKKIDPAAAANAGIK